MSTTPRLRRSLAVLAASSLLVACGTGATTQSPRSPTPASTGTPPVVDQATGAHGSDSPPPASTTHPSPHPPPGEGRPSQDDRVPLTFMAGFQPQANLPFVGVYVADARGMFARRGLDVTITHSAGGGEHLQLLTADAVQVTTQDAAVLLERRADPGLPLVSLALLGQRGQQAFVALADSGIETPGDWVGRTVGYKGTPPPDVFAIMDAFGVDPGEVDLVNVGFDPRVLTERQVDVYPVYKSNEPDTLEGWGYEVRQWEAADYDIPMLGLTYVATEETVATDPEMLDAFVDAAMEGVAWAAENPEEAVDIVATWTGPGTDLDHQRFLLDTELADATSAVTERFGLGWQTRAQWQDLHDLLLDYDALTTPVDVEAVFTTQFLD